jgi:hypothetical protein
VTAVNGAGDSELDVGECSVEAIEVGEAAAVTTFSGKAHGIGRGRNRAGLALAGRFTSSSMINLDATAATVRIGPLLREVGVAEEVVARFPTTLVADPRNNATTGTFKTPDGELPVVKATIGARGRGQFVFSIEVSGATIKTPSQCPAADLATTFTIDDGVNPSVPVAAKRSWRCFGPGNEYLRTP